MGAWNAADAQKGQAANKAYTRASFDFFTATGTGTPRIPLEAATAWTSYLNKSLSAKRRSRRCLRIANYFAAPFGSRRVQPAQLRGRGRGLHHGRATARSSPPTGTKYAGSVVTTYNFLASPNNTIYNAGYPDVTKASASWGQRNAKYGYQPLFYELNVTVPNSLSAPTRSPRSARPTNIMYEVVRGRATIADYQSTLATWKRNGGTKLKAFYAGSPRAAEEAGDRRDRRRHRPRPASRRPWRRAVPGRPRRRPAYRRRRWLARLRRDRTLLIMTLPALVLLARVRLRAHARPGDGVPGLRPVRRAAAQPVGRAWRTSSSCFTDPGFWHAFENTLVLFSVQLVLSFPVPIALAILLDSLLSRRLRGHHPGRGDAAALLLVRAGRHDLQRDVRRRRGCSTPSCATTGSTSPFNFMTNPGTFKFLVTSQLIWKEAGWSTIVFLAALSAISPALYEAAAVDGAGLLAPAAAHHAPRDSRASPCCCSYSTSATRSPSASSRCSSSCPPSAPGAAQVITTFSFENGIVAGNYSYGAAAGLFLGLTSVILILGANKVAHLFGEDGLYRK